MRRGGLSLLNWAIRLAGMNRRSYSFPRRLLAKVHRGCAETIEAMIHNEIPQGFTTDTAWWALMRCFWIEEPKSALCAWVTVGSMEVGEQGELGMDGGLFCQARGKAVLILIHCLVNFARGVDSFGSISSHCIFILLCNLLLSVKSETSTTIRALEQARPINSVDVWCVQQEAITSQRYRVCSSKAKG